METPLDQINREIARLEAELKQAKALRSQIMNQMKEKKQMLAAGGA